MENKKKNRIEMFVAYKSDCIRYNGGASEMIQ